MRSNIFFRKNMFKLISILEISLGLILLIFEIQSIYYRLNILNDLSYGLKQLVSYEPIQFGDLLLGIMILFTGLSYWIDKRIHWIFTQITLSLLLFKVWLPYYIYFGVQNPITIYIPPILFTLLIIYFEIRLLNIKSLESIVINNKIKLAGMIVSILCSILYFLLKTEFYY